MSSPIDAKVWASLEALEAAGTPGFLRELVAEFLVRAPASIQALREAGARCDTEALEREAHRFKGSCGSIGASAMAACCDRLETMGRERSPNGQDEAIADLEKEWRTVRAALEGALARPRPDV